MEGWMMIRTRYHEAAVTHCLRLVFRLWPYRTHDPSVQSGIEPGLRARLGLRRRGECSHNHVDVDGRAALSFVWHFAADGVDSGDFSVFDA